MIYFDNSATTYPKPDSVSKAVNLAMKKYSFNSGRGSYKSSVDTSSKIFSVREDLAGLLNFQEQNIAFTQNCTMALNMAIKGVLKKGDHVIISPLEHNSVSRVIYDMSVNNGVEVDIPDFSFDKEEMLSNFKKLVKANTKAIVCMYASNAFGYVFPIKELGDFCSKNGIIFIVDGAQAVGVFDIDMQLDKIDILCSAGHKCLYGPMGTGFIAINNDIKISPIMQGGTGSNSKDLIQPSFMPDLLESGTLNNVGIIGLGAGVNFVKSKGIRNIYNHEFDIVDNLNNELKNINNVELYVRSLERHSFAPILSFNYKDYSSEKTASLLADKGIAVRAGFHCSLLAHKVLGTLDRGTVRISPSIFNSFNECEKFLNYLKKL